MKKTALKTFIFTLIVTVLFVAASVNAGASEAFTEGYYTYTVSDNEAIITSISEEASGELIIPDTLGGYPVRALEEQAFSACNKVTSVIISDNVREMKGGFGWYSLLEHIDFGDGIEEINDDFYKTYSLKTVNIGKKLRTIPSYGIFDCCLRLEKITVDKENPYFYSDEYGALYDKVNSVLVRYPEASKATSYAIAEGTKAIGPYAFSDCMYLESVTIPDSLEKIGQSAFSFSSGIKELHIPSSVKTIEDAAFTLSFSLEKLYFEADAEIGEYIIGTYIELLRPATEIAELLTQQYIALGNGDEDKADEFEAEFYNSVNVGDEIYFTTTICCHDDDKTSELEEYATSYGMPFERSHFYADEWTYDWENNIKYRACTFEGCTATIEEQLEKEESDFSYIVLEDGTAEITGYSGPDVDIVIPSEIDGYKVTSIADNVFWYYGGSAFTSIYIPETVTNIGFMAFFECGPIEVDENNQYYSSDKHGALFDKNKTVLIQYPGLLNKATSYEVPETVTTIGAYAFNRSIYLEDITLPCGLLYIEEAAFYECVALRELNLPLTLKEIGFCSFGSCIGLTEITVPDNVEKLAEGAFSHCLYLDKIYVKSMNIEAEAYSLNGSGYSISGMTQETCIELFQKFLPTYSSPEPDEETRLKIHESLTYYDDIIHLSTIYCHADSSAEAYAIEHAVSYELTHFFDMTKCDSETQECYTVCSLCGKRESENTEADTSKFQYTVLEDGTAEITGYSGSDSVVVIPEKIDGFTVTAIGELVFYFSYETKEIYIPKSIKAIDEKAFVYCYNVEFITVDEENEYYCNDNYGALYNKDKTELILFPRMPRQENYTVPATVEKFAEYSMYFNAKLMELNFAEGTESIYVNPLYIAVNLREINFPSTAKNIVFGGEQLLTLTTVVIPDGVERVEGLALTDGAMLKEVYIKGLDTVIDFINLSSDYYIHEDKTDKFLETIYNLTYEQNKNISFTDEKIFEELIEECIVYEKRDAVIYCHSGSTAEAYAIENGLSYELTHFFEGEWIYDSETMTRSRKCIHCDELEEESYGEEESHFSYIVLEDGTAEITGYRGKKDVVVPSEIDGYKVTSIGNYAFSEINIKSVVIPDSVVSLGYGVFSHTATLESVDLGDGVVSIGNDTFYKSYGLKTVHIGKNLKYIGDESFEITFNLTEITVDPENETFYSDGPGVLIDKINKTLVAYPAANPATSYEVPEGIEAISDCAFYDSLYLKNVTLPESLKYIGEDAFALASALEEITIPEAVEYIGFGAFTHCFAMKNVYVLTHDAEFDGLVYGYELIAKEGFSYVYIAELIRQAYEIGFNGDLEKFEALQREYHECFIFFDELTFGDATFYCHDDGKPYTVEAQTEYGISVELYHPYEDEWTYDWDNNIKYRACTFEGCKTRLEEAIEDESTDVEIIAPSDPDADFDIDKIEEGSDNYILVQNALSETNYTLLKAFDITMKNKDGVHVQPSGTVKVKLPIDWEKDGNYKVFRVNADGTLTDMNAYRQGSHMVFETDHFSIYIIVEEKAGEAPVEPDVPVEPDEPVEPDAPENSDLTSKIISLLIDFFKMLTSFIKSIF